MFALRLEGLKGNPEAFGSSYEQEVNMTDEVIAERYASSPESFTIGAFDADGPVGLAMFRRETHVKLRHRGSVYAMYVSPRARRMGAGRGIMEELVTRVRKIEGLEQVHLDVVTVSPGAKALYESVGFETSYFESKLLKFDGQYFDFDHMVLHI